VDGNTSLVPNTFALILQSVNVLRVDSDQFPFSFLVPRPGPQEFHEAVSQRGFPPSFSDAKDEFSVYFQARQWVFHKEVLV